MEFLGADLPVVALILAASVCVIWGWIISMRHTSAVRQMVEWLRRQDGEAWDALPWTSRRLMLQSGISAMKRRGLADDPGFRALEDRARRLDRVMLTLILAGGLCLAFVIIGITSLGWNAG